MVTLKIRAGSLLAAGLMILHWMATSAARAETVTVISRQATPQAQYAARKLQAALTERRLTQRSTHGARGEGMGGMTPVQRQQWIDEILLAGMRDAKRPAKLIYRVPFSSGTSSEPGVSNDVEQTTRAAIERLDGQSDGPIWVEVKFNWSHGHSSAQSYPCERRIRSCTVKPYATT